MVSQVSAEEAASSISCDLDEGEDNEANERRGLQKAASRDSLQFLVPLQHDDADDADADDDDESYSIPLSMRRPRSDSGSRYLTDDVRHYVLLFNLIKTLYLATSCNVIMPSSFCDGRLKI